MTGKISTLKINRQQLNFDSIQFLRNLASSEVLRESINVEAELVLADDPELVHNDGRVVVPEFEEIQQELLVDLPGFVNFQLPSELREVMLR